LNGGFTDVKNGYQPRTNIVKNEKGDFATDFHNTLDRWKSHFSQLLNVHGVDDVEQTEIHTKEQIVPELSTFAFGWILKSQKVTNHQVFIKSHQN
jgi:hypothetical protein